QSRPSFPHPPLTVAIFFFNDTPTPEIYTLSLHDALPISDRRRRQNPARAVARGYQRPRYLPEHRASLRTRAALQRSRGVRTRRGDRKSTRLNSSHVAISYAVFCLKKKKKTVIRINNIER